MTHLHHIRQHQHSGSSQHVRNHGHHAQPRETIKRGILTAFYPTTYTADVLIMEATSTYLQGIAVACHLAGSSTQINTWCAVLFFDVQNPTDAVVLAVYPNGSQGIPSPSPGRITFVPAYQQITNSTINSGNTSIVQISGNGAIPFGALGISFSGNFTGPSAGAYLQIGPNGASNLGQYVTLGNLPVANGYVNGYVNGTGLIPLDSLGKIALKANSGNCIVNLFSQGYII